MVSTANQIYRNWEIDGVPSSGLHEPELTDIRAWGSWVEGIIAAFTATGGLIYVNLAAINADLVHDANTMAWVVGDTTTAFNGIYQKSGGSGFGGWTRVGDLPYSFIVASDTGAGTPNAIQATSSLPVTGSSLIWLNVFDTNTTSPVTVSFNGDAPLTIKTNSGNNPIVGGLTAGMTIMGIVSGSVFKLVSDQASAAILAACEAAVVAASAYADFARNNWAVLGPFTGTGVVDDLYGLSIDPGSANNMFPIVGGISQMLSDAAYQLVYVSGSPKIKITVPLGVLFEVRVSNAIPIGTPADGSVTDVKLGSAQLKAISALASAADKVPYSTGSNTWALSDFTSFARTLVAATTAALARTALGLGSLATLSAWASANAPSGTVVDSVSFVNSSYAATASVIPLDDTIPQITEGAEILTATITPKSTTNKLRIRFSAVASVSSASAILWAIFNGSSGAIRAGFAHEVTTDAAQHVVGEVEYTPGATTPQTISVRLGSGGGSTVRINGLSARFLGGAAGAQLIIEEIKA